MSTPTEFDKELLEGKDIDLLSVAANLGEEPSFAYAMAEAIKQAVDKYVIGEKEHDEYNLISNVPYIARNKLRVEQRQSLWGDNNDQR